MTEEMYNRLNDYLNDIFLELNKKDKIFVDNLKSIVILNTIIDKLFNGCITSECKVNNLSFNDVFLLGRKIIDYINPKYLEEYDELISSGKLEFNYDGNCKSAMHYKLNSDIKFIDIERYFNYEDVITLIHEFIHYSELKEKNKITYNYDFFTEFIAIYFEKIANKYLIEEKNIPINEIPLNLREISLYRHNREFYKYSVILLAYEKFGNINENTTNDLDKLLKFKDNSFEQECIELLQKFDKINETNNEKDSVIKMTELVNYNYKYIVGTFLAHYALEHSKIEDMVKLNDNINTEEYANLSVEEILNTVGIKINEEMINQTVDIIKNSIHHYEEKTK